ncbi:hypothetical protein F0U44_07690 [Nocardioides humilatus]|uniref:Uncharacterized protein n=1 Tax=Nocardioides humilatus TaxID=2607660 RepID=A0A5B1LJA9_9ACTN|nr:hypothetical protein [Nocardioides humilatus]KAA1420288.1 hypothetical protein F0U44_07690 [Nocardioides humilatus]
MDVNRYLLSTLLRLHPEAWDAIIPHSIFVAKGVRFGKSLVELAVMSNRLGQPVRPMAEWTDNGDLLDDLGDDSAIAALIAKLLANPGPVVDEEIKPHWRNEVLAGVALGLASGGALVDSNQFLSEVFSAAVSGVSDVDVRRQAA